jgi:hypothetical protein
VSLQLDLQVLPQLFVGHVFSQLAHPQVNEQLRSPHVSPHSMATPNPATKNSSGFTASIADLSPRLNSGISPNTFSGVKTSLWKNFGSFRARTRIRLMTSGVKASSPCSRHGGGDDAEIQ